MAHERHIHGFMPGFLVECFKKSGWRTASVGYQDIQSAERSCDFFYQVFRRGRQGDVARESERLYPSFLRECFCSSGDLGFVPTVKSDQASFTSESKRSRVSQAARSK